MPITLTPEVAKSGIVLTEDVTQTQDPEVVQRRIDNAQYAAPRLEPNLISNDYWLGMEDRLREQVVTMDAIEARQRKQQMVQYLAQSAAEEGRSLSELDRSFIMSMSEEDMKNPAVVLEQKYAERFAEETTRAGVAALKRGAEDARTFEPQKAEEVYNATADITSKQQIARKIFEDVQQKQKETSWLDFGVDFVQGIIPGYSWLSQRNRLTDEDSFALGQNIQQQIRGMYLLPADQFEARAREVLMSMADDNVLEALNLSAALVEYSGGDAAWDNVFTGLDALDVATLGGVAALKGLRSSQRIGAMSKSAVKGLVKSDSAIARDVVSGNVREAAEKMARDRAESAVEALAPTSDNVAAATTRPQRQLQDLSTMMPTFLDPKSYFRNAGSLAGARAQRLLESLTHNRDVLMSTLTDLTHVQRVTNPQAVDAAFKNAEQAARRQYFRHEDAIVDIRRVNEAEEVYGGVDHIEVLFGKADGTPFQRETQAAFHADKMLRLPKDSYDIVLEDGNWFVRTMKTVDETAGDVLAARIQTDNATPKNFVNTYLGFLRSSDDVLAKEHNQWRKVATYGGNAAMTRLSAVGKKIGSLSGNEAKRLRTILDDARFEWRDIIDTDGKSKRVQGRFYDTIDEVEKAYLQKFKTAPSDKELEAYFSFRDIMDWDFAQRNITIARDKARMGIEQKQIGISVPDGDTGKFTYRRSEFFEGRTVDSLPANASVGWTSPSSGRGKFTLRDRAFPAQRKELDEMLESGNYQIIQVADVKSKAVRDMFGSKGEPVEFIVVKDVKTKPLSPKQIGYNEGGHWNYPSQGFYMKQAQTHKTGFGRRVYDGDVTAMYFPSGKAGKDMVNAYETARRMYLERDPGLDAFVTRNLPYDSGDAFARMFRTADNAGPFDPQVPFVLTETGQKATDITRLSDYFQEEWVDTAASPNNLMSKVNSEYAQQRSERLLTTDNVGTEANPIHKIDHADLVDPLATLSRTAAKMARSRFYDDYVHRSVEDWVTQFADLIDAPKASVLADPMRYLNEPVWRPKMDTEALRAAQNSRSAIRRLLGQETADSLAWKWTRQKITDQVYSRLGKKGTKIVDPYLWNSNTDPATMARSITFHAKLGLMNVVQLPLQAVSMIHAMALDGNPVRAAQSVFAYWAMRGRGLAESNPRAQGMFSKLASNALGVPTDQLDEMYDAWKRSGMHVIEGEYSKLDDYLNPKMFFGRNKALDAGTMFFKEGNNVHRGTSFALSYLRWRDMNPKARLTNKALANIVERADMGYINMSRASNATWQEGIPSVPTQFFAYHARLFEQFAGGRLTLFEKGRILAMYSAMWGVPVGGAGGAVGLFWPAGDSIRQAALENGQDQDADLLTSVLTRGIADMAVEMLTGEDFNVSERYGPGGLTWLDDLTSGNFGEVLGASPNFISSLWEVADPFRMATAQLFFGGGEHQFEITQADFVDALREVSSVNNVVRALQVYNAGEWLTKNDGYIADVEKGDPMIAIAAALGMSPQEVHDNYLKLDSINSFEDARRQVEKQVLVEFERGLKAATNRDRGQTLTFYKRAFALMETAGFTPIERQRVFRRAMKENKAMVDGIDRDFVLIDPEKRLQPYLDKLEEN